MKLKTILAFCLAALPLVAQQITLTTSPVRPGATSTIQVTLSGSAGSAAAIQWFIPAMPGMAATAGPAATAAGKTLTCATANGLFGCILAGINTTTLSDGVLAMVTVPSPAAPTPLTLTSMLGVNLAATSEIPVGSGTPLVLASLSPCDTNGDGRTDVLDIRNIIDQIEGVIAPVTDLNGDGRTTLIDLQRVVNASVDNGSCRVGV